MSIRKKLLVIINVDWYLKLHWLERLEFFQRSNYQISVLTNFTDASFKCALEELGISCHHVAFQRASLNPFKECLTIFQMARVVQKFKPDIVHAITIKPYIYFGIINQLCFKAPAVYTAAGLGRIYTSQSISSRIIRIALRFVIPFVANGRARFIFENSDDFDTLVTKANLPASKGQVIIGAGINLKLYKSHALEERCLGNILFAGRLLVEKGLQQLIDAKKLLAERGIPITINVAGIVDSDCLSAIPLSQVESWHDGGLINWLGQCDNMEKVIAENSIICLPSTYGEGVPRILIEGAASGKAIVATDVTGCREVVIDGYNGYLVAPGYPAELGSAIEKLLSHELCARFGLNSRELAVKKFDQNIVFRKTIDVYNEVLKS